MAIRKKGFPMTSAAKQKIGEAASERADLARIALKASAEVEFRGLFKVRLLLGEDGKRRVVVNDIADAMGLTRQGLHDRARRRFAKGISMTLAPSDGGEQDTLALDIHYLPALLMGIDVGRCRESIQPRLTEIQEEFYDVLARYVFEGVAVNPEFGPQRSVTGFAEFTPTDGRPKVIIDEPTGRALGTPEDLAALFSRVAELERRPAQTPEPASPSGEAVWAMVAEALMRLEKVSADVTALKLASGTVSTEQLLELDDAVARLAWLRVALGYQPTIKAAKAWIQGRIAAAADWSGTGRSRRNMPASSWPKVKVCLAQIRVDLEAEAKRRDIPKDVLERAYATAQLGLFTRAA